MTCADEAAAGGLRVGIQLTCADVCDQFCTIWNQATRQTLLCISLARLKPVTPHTHWATARGPGVPKPVLMRPV